MNLYCAGLASRYESENVGRLFYPRLTPVDGRRRRGDDSCCFVRVNRRRVFAGYVGAADKKAAVAPLKAGDDPELTGLTLLYDLLCGRTGYTPKWGMLTGVRPVGFLRSLAAKYGLDGAKQVFRKQYGVSEEKLALAAAVLEQQGPIIAASRPMSYSLYISIPFCPTRCTYCSFVSRTTAAEEHLIPAYIDKLCEELAFTAAQAEKIGLELETVYVGGGTPTAITAGQLATLLGAVNRLFPMHTVKEFTVEAGRPDTITREKFEVLRAAGVSRISINPQTLNDEVLRRVRRPHTAEDFIRCFHMAREMGFHNINTDLIAGLPGDTLDGFTDTITGILALRPENVTVHTLTLKRASEIVIAGPDGEYDDVAAMLGQNARLTGAGYVPYYLYRQKATLQNLENTGFTLPGYAGLYNVHIMEETHTILSCGAGGSTKLKGPCTGRIERVFNYKFPADYIERFDTLLEKKKKVEAFYAGDMDTETSC